MIGRIYHEETDEKENVVYSVILLHIMSLRLEYGSSVCITPAKTR